MCVFFDSVFVFAFLLSDASTYAHFLFNAFDTDHNGSVSFEVSGRVESPCTVGRSDLP